MSEQYTPTNEEVRKAFTRSHVWASAESPERVEQWDRWLAEHDRQVAERVWDEGHSAGVFDKTYGTGTRNPHEATKEEQS